MARHKQFDEEVVLKKAMVLFWKNGFHDTSIQELVEHLGINRASLYDTFGGKDALFEKAFEQYRQMNTEAAEKILASEQSAKAGLRQLFLASLESAIGDPERKGCFVVNTTTELLPNDEKWRPVLDRNRKIFEAIFLRQLERGVAQGEISPDKNLKDIASMLFALNNGIGVVSKINPSKHDLIKVVDAALRVLD
ncbi:MAG: TetR/AcrR family transcriptional regulator [Saprospiraceae bacterium]|nr:TetR/AcrR family transcriptional regulator [Saprospiraceae bacterium]